jgi:hypothetical protein
LRRFISIWRLAIVELVPSRRRERRSAFYGDFGPLLAKVFSNFVSLQVGGALSVESALAVVWRQLLWYDQSD